MTPDIVHCVERDEVLTVNDGKRYILLELPSQTVPIGIRETLFQLRVASITPILSHPERNLAVQRDTNLLVDLAEAGALFQITAHSLTGRFGRRAERCAASLLDQNLVHFIASDAHSSEGRVPRLSAACERAARSVGADAAGKLVRDNPQKIVAGEPFLAGEPRRRRSRFARLFGR